VRTGSSLKSVAELVAVAKANADRVTYASAGNGAPGHLAGELFARRTGVALRHIPYKGIAQGLTALLGEHVDVAFAGVAGAAPLLRSGKLRALATSAPARLPAFPDVPTVAEVGYAGYAVDEWYGVVAPAGIPADVVARLSHELTRAVLLPQSRERLELLGLYPSRSTGPEALAALIAGELARWPDLVRDAGIRAD
jgi:tripartite-type tricarboxylate transporter receptor subunit TctC